MPSRWQIHGRGHDTRVGGTRPRWCFSTYIKALVAFAALAVVWGVMGVNIVSDWEAAEEDGKLREDRTPTGAPAPA